MSKNSYSFFVLWYNHVCCLSVRERGKPMIPEVLLDTVEDVLKILPFLFMTYLLLEWLEQKTEHRFQQILEKQHKMEPLYGALLGLFPSCGLSGGSFLRGSLIFGALFAVPAELLLA